MCIEEHQPRETAAGPVRTFRYVTGKSLADLADQCARNGWRLLPRVERGPDFTVRGIAEVPER